MLNVPRVVFRLYLKAFPRALHTSRPGPPTSDLNLQMLFRCSEWVDERIADDNVGRNALILRSGEANHRAAKLSCGLRPSSTRCVYGRNSFCSLFVVFQSPQIIYQVRCGPFGLYGHLCATTRGRRCCGKRLRYALRNRTALREHRTLAGQIFCRDCA
jgi:hypothetical protein